MMKQLAFATLLLGLSGTPLLYAQLFEVGLHAGVHRLGGRNLGTFDVGPPSPQNPDVRLNDGWRFGFRMTVNSDGFTGHEFGYAYNRTALRFEVSPPVQQGMAAHQGFYHFLIYGTREGSRVRPFVAGGGQFTNFVPPGATVQWGGGDNKFGFNYGGGVKFRVTPIWGLRFDLREYYSGKPFSLPAGFSLMM
jgi:opacity protein-like surface antigen